MLSRFSFLILSLVLAVPAGAAIVATYRGNNPNPFSLKSPYIGESDFDLNGDGTADLQFWNGTLLGGIKSYHNTRIIGGLEILPDVGTHTLPVFSGNLIGSDTSSLSGIGVTPGENVPDPALSTGAHLLWLNDLTCYIGVELQLEDGIHYGWISYMGFDSPDTNTNYPNTGGFIDVWAWETEPGKPIVAGQVPEPGAGTLVPAAALWLLHRRRTAAGRVGRGACPA